MEQPPKPLFPSALFPAYQQGDGNKNVAAKSDSPSDWLSFSSYKQPNESNKKKSGDKQEKYSEIDDIKVPESRHDRDSRSRPKDRHRSSHKRPRSSSLSSTTSSSSSRPPESVYDHLKRKVFIEGTGLAPEHAYFIDPKPDRNNFAFNSLYNIYVPEYDKKKCINIAKRRYDDKSKKKAIRYYFEDAIKMIKTKTTVDFSYIKFDLPTKSFDFIPIKNDSIEVKKIDAVNPLGIYDSATSCYIQGKDKVEDIPLPSESIEFSSLKSNDDKTSEKSKGPVLVKTEEQINYEKTEEFNRYLREHPNDVDMWLEFIRFQSDKLSGDQKIEGKPIDVGIWEKKLSIVNKALELNPKCIRLSLEKLDILSNLWEPNKLSSEWQKLTFLHPNEMAVWNEYINFSINQISHFSVSKTIKVYKKCVSKLLQMLDPTFKSHVPPKNLELELIAVLAHFCEFLRNVGHCERAVALFQALIEFNIFVPQILIEQNTPLAEMITYFEPFWDSGMARFGEDNSLGWNQITKMSNNEQQFSDVNLDEEEKKIVDSNSDKYKCWLEFELLREAYHWMPVKSSEEVDDPERNVLFDDIKSFFICFQSEDAKFELIMRFLEFLKVKVNRKVLSIFDMNLPKETKMNACINLEPTLLIGIDKLISNIFQSSIKLFNGKKRLELILNQLNYKKDKICISTGNNKTLLKNFRKLIKSFLKEDEFRNSLELWSLFAEFEWISAKNSNEGRKIFQTAISLITDHRKPKNFLEFILKYVKLELNISTLDAMSAKLFSRKETISSTTNQLVINALLTAAIGENITNYTPVHLLKAKNNLLKYSSTSNEHLFCLALIIYMTQGLEPASVLLEEELSLIKDEEREKQIFIFYIQLWLVNLQYNFGSQLTPLYNLVNRALNQFPSELDFLITMIHLHSTINGHVRIFFTKTLAKGHHYSADQNFTIVCLAVYSELVRLSKVHEICQSFDAGSGIINRVRSIFEKSLSSSVMGLSSNLILWRSYIKFEITFGTPKKAKSIFYRALQRCPSSKQLFLEGIRYFKSDQFLQEMIDIMTEKELRVRTPLEEVEMILKSLPEVQSNNEKP